MSWLRKLFGVTRETQAKEDGASRSTAGTPSTQNMEAEKQYALTLNVSELQSIVAGNAVWTAIGYSQKMDVSKEVARKAIPVVQMIMDGDALVSRNDLDGALVKYKAAIASEAKCAIAHMAIGTVYYRKKDFASALKWTRMAAELDPLNSRIKDNLECAEANFQDAFSGAMADRQKRSEAMLTAGIVRRIESKTLPSAVPGVLGGTGKDTYDVYEAKSTSDATDFLAGLHITEQQKYAVVETPDGPIGRDLNGIYKPSKNWRGNDWNRF